MTPRQDRLLVLVALALLPQIASQASRTDVEVLLPVALPGLVIAAVAVGLTASLTGART